MLARTRRILRPPPMRRAPRNRRLGARRRPPEEEPRSADPFAFLFGRDMWLGGGIVALGAVCVANYYADQADARNTEEDAREAERRDAIRKQREARRRELDAPARRAHDAAPRAACESRLAVRPRARPLRYFSRRPGRRSSSQHRPLRAPQYLRRATCRARTGTRRGRRTAVLLPAASVGRRGVGFAAPAAWAVA